ncbi:MAG: citramalate synthase, partial [Christensenellaceae bacterium]|nr:citramalate synthase [Christensenellaceae bacterium]
MTKITILDSTLREGAQSESISFSDSDKISILQLLDKLGIDFAECGNPSANEKDLRFFNKLTNIKFNKLKVVPFGSTCRKNTPAYKDTGLIALLGANTEYVTIFGKSSLLHVTDVLKVSKAENLRMIEESIKFLTDKRKRVFYDAEHFFDGYKFNKEYAIETLRAASKGGAEILVLCDTNGGSFPNEIEEIYKVVANTFSNKKIGIHCHNDCGLAIANTLVGINNGAFQAQCTVGGIGERCGNADLCTLLPILQLKMGFKLVSDEQLTMLTRISRNIFELLNISLSPRAPFIGKSAFAHKGGMHIDGVLKNSSSFEHIEPHLVGNQRRILISDQSGKTSVYTKLKGLIPNIDRNSEEVQIITDMIKKHSQYGYSYENADASFEIDALKALGMESNYFK